MSGLDKPTLAAGCLSQGLAAQLAALPRDGAHDLLQLSARDAIGIPECVAHAHLLNCMMDLNMDDVWRSVPCTQEAVRRLLQHSMLCQNVPQRHVQDWVRWEAMKVRILFAYFVRLCKRSEWSHNLTIARLKDKYWNRPGRRSSSSKSLPAALDDDIDGSMQIPSPPSSSDECEPEAAAALDDVEVIDSSSDDDVPAAADISGKAPPLRPPGLELALAQARAAAHEPVDHQDHKRRLRERKRQQQRPTGVKKRPAAAAHAHLDLPSQQLPTYCVRSRLEYAAGLEEPELEIDSDDLGRLRSLEPTTAHDVLADPRGH